jgi:hypothetical protein
LDNPAAESSDLSVDDAAKAFASLIDPEPPKEEDPPKVDTEVDPPKEEELKEPEPNAAEEGDDAPLTIEVDGKQITLTKEQIAEAYKNGLRQSDYTQKTMAVAEQRKAAEAETAKAREERARLSQELQRTQTLLEGAIEQQSKIDWPALIESNPVEALRQQHLLQQRQAALKEANDAQARLAQQIQSDQLKAYQSHLATQQEQLLAKLPEWKDEAKATTERAALKSYLREQGFEESDVNAISDHRAVILGRKAMLYDQMMAKAKAAAKKVENVPTKVVRPGVPNEGNTLDGRTQAMRRHAKEGSIESAAAAFAQIL